MKKAPMPQVEIRVPISANEKYFRMLQHLITSVYMYGGNIVESAKFVVSISRDEEYINLYKEYPWTQSYPIEFRWIDQKLFDDLEYDGTGLDRYLVKSNADIIIMCDADILITGNLDDVILDAFKMYRQLGFIAHVSPFCTPEHSHISSKDWWEKIFRATGQLCPPLSRRHTGWNVMNKDIKHRESPYYFNYGFIVSPREFIEKIAKSYEDDIKSIDNILDTWFKSQIARTVVCSRHKFPSSTLSLNYNYPLHVDEVKFREINPDPEGKNSPEDIKVFHYLGMGEFNKEDFATSDSLQNALQKEDISKSGKIFKKKLQVINNKINKKEQKVMNEDDTELYIICGGRRTGTTLLEAMLTSDDRSNPILQESQILTRYLEAHRWSKNNFKDFGLSYFEDYHSYFLFTKKWINDLIEKMGIHASPSDVLIIKNPELSNVLPQIAELLPQAKIIATVRDPRDQICSEITVAENRVTDGLVGKNYEVRQINNFIKSYKNYLTNILTFHKTNPGKILILRYEDLVLKPIESISFIEKATNLNLQFNPKEDWKKVSKNTDFHSAPSRSELYGKPISDQSVGRFKNDLSSEEIKMIEASFKEFMDEYHYKR